MTDLQAAAERLRILSETTSTIAAYGKEWAAMEVGRDRNVVIDAYLAEHDPSPITPEALEALGFSDEVDGDWRHPCGLYVSLDQPAICLHLEDLPWLNLGQLRRLVGVLTEGK